MLTEMNSLIPSLLIKFVKEPESEHRWSDPPQMVEITHPNNIKSELISGHLLEGGNILISLWQLFRIYTQEMTQLQDIHLNSFFQGLGVMCEFKHLKHAESNRFVLALQIEELSEAEAMKIEHIDDERRGTGAHRNYLIAETIVHASKESIKKDSVEESKQNVLNIQFKSL